MHSHAGACPIPDQVSLIKFAHYCDSTFGRYFFHATQEKMDASEFVEDAEDLMDTSNYEMDIKTPLFVKDEATDDKAEEVEVNPALADWFKVEQEDIPKFVENSDTETEDDSDHDDLPPDEDDGDDKWLDVSPEDAKSSLDVKVVQSDACSGKLLTARCLGRERRGCEDGRD